MSVLVELVVVIVGGFVAFLGFLIGLLAVLLLWLLSLASGLCLMVAVFAGVMYWFTGTPHDGWIALGFLFDAAVPFVLIFVGCYYAEKLNRARQRRQAIPNIGGLRLARDAGFEETADWRCAKYAQRSRQESA